MTAITIVANTPPLAAGPAIDVERLADLRRHHEYGCGECATRMSWPHRSRERAKP